MIRRREFLSLSISVSASQAFAVPIKNLDGETENDPTETGTGDEGTDFINEVRLMATFKAYIDTLLPADEYSQSASALGVDTEMLTVANENEAYKRLIYRGCEWLNAAAKYEGNRGGKFATLTEQARIKIVEVAESTGEGKAGPARFVGATLQHANQIYYSKPEVWKSLGYDGPPQPYGFPDYQQPFLVIESP